MQKGIFLSVLLLLAVTINTGCEKLDVTKDLDLEIELVAISATADFSAEKIFDAASYSSEIAEYSEKITDIEVTEVTATITAFNGPPGQKIVTATLTVADETGAGEEVIGTISNQDISNSPGPIIIPLNQAGVDRFAELIKNSPHKALVKNFGSADSEPIDFTVVFKFKVKMTANPL